MSTIDPQALVAIARRAGEAVLAVYRQADLGVTTKADDSPLTLADLAAHRLIVQALGELDAAIPVISEESEDLSWARRQPLRCYWLVDPLDGTKEFIRRNGEFTVNIALIEDHRPVLGVVHAPVKNLTYLGQPGRGAFRIAGEGAPEPLRVAAVPGPEDVWRVLDSRSHPSEALTEFLSAFGKVHRVSVGSSLKFCLIAEGSADLYPRFGPTSEWDTAAAQAVVEAAGGQVLAWPSLQPLRYNTKEALLNPHFVVCQRPTTPWFGGANITPATGGGSPLKQPAVIWFTGLSGAGKTTSAIALEAALRARGCSTYRLDGDELRKGLCADLGFSEDDRRENIRRAGEVAKLMVDAGLTVLVSFISPFARDRLMVRQMLAPGAFIEVHVNTPLATCEARDPKGLYKKARAGAISDFTGVDSPYEVPLRPDIEINTAEQSVEEVVTVLIEGLSRLRD